jgi:hypothetical protein
MAAEMGIGLGESDEQRSDGRPQGKGRTLGEQFVNSPAFQEWMKQIAPNGRVPEKGRISSPGRVPQSAQEGVDYRIRRHERGAVCADGLYRDYEQLGRQPLTLRDLVSIRTTEAIWWNSCGRPRR